MSIVARNKNKAVMAAGAMALANHFGQIAFSSSGKQLMYDGAKYIATKLWNKRFGQGGKGRDVVSHPGAMRGAVAAPTAITRILRGSKPQFKRGKGSVTITHRELIGQFNTSVDLVVNDGTSGAAGGVYKLNPGNAVLFPWLQTMASNFEQYKFDSVRLQYVPLCNTLTTGRVALYYDKDSQDEQPADRVELANMAHLTETSPWAEASLSIPTDAIKRFTTDSATTDRKLIDLGQVGVATYGGPPSDVASGDVFIHYTVTFFTPQPSSGLVGSLNVILGSPSFDGPRYTTVVSDGVDLAIAFNTPGTFLVALNLSSTTSGTLSATTGAVINSSTNIHSGTLGMYLFNVTVTTTGAGVAVNGGTALGDFSIHVIRARKANTVLP